MQEEASRLCAKMPLSMRDLVGGAGRCRIQEPMSLRYQRMTVFMHELFVTIVKILGCYQEARGSVGLMVLGTCRLTSGSPAGSGIW